jgi:hypothetical protein
MPELLPDAVADLVEKATGRFSTILILFARLRLCPVRSPGFSRFARKTA